MSSISHGGGGWRRGGEGAGGELRGGRGGFKPEPGVQWWILVSSEYGSFIIYASRPVSALVSVSHFVTAVLF